jgi:hypothetical protein
MLRNAAEVVPSGRQRGVMRYAALYAEVQAERRDAVEWLLERAAREVMIKMRRGPPALRPGRKRH